MRDGACWDFCSVNDDERDERRDSSTFLVELGLVDVVM